MNVWEAAITDYGNSVLYSSARNEQLIVRMETDAGTHSMGTYESSLRQEILCRRRMSFVSLEERSTE